MSASKDNVADELRAELKRVETEKQAIIKEFTEKPLEEWSPEALKEKMLKEICPDAWASLKRLITMADSETVQANLIKWTFEFVFKPVPQDESPDAENDKTLAQLLEAISKTS